jgi:hypothetical protein
MANVSITLLKIDKDLPFKIVVCFVSMCIGAVFCVEVESV